MLIGEVGLTNLAGDFVRHTTDGCLPFTIVTIDKICSDCGRRVGFHLGNEVFISDLEVPHGCRLSLAKTINSGVAGELYGVMVLMARLCRILRIATVVTRTMVPLLVFITLLNVRPEGVCTEGYIYTVGITAIVSLLIVGVVGHILDSMVISVALEPEPLPYMHFSQELLACHAMPEGTGGYVFT